MVLMISFLPLISSSLRHYFRFLITILSPPITIGITVTFTLHIFSALWEGPGTCSAFRLLSVSLNDPMERQNPPDKFSFALVY